MDLILGVGLAVVGLLAATQLILWIVVASRLIKMPLRAPLPLPIQRSSVVDALPVLDSARAPLEDNGFHYTHTRRVRSLVAIHGLPPSYCDAYYHAEHDIHAEVHLATPPTPHKLCEVYLWNTFVDGTALLTVNKLMATLIPYPSNIRIADGQAPDLAGQVATHLATRQSIVQQRTDPADALQMAKTMAEQLLPQMEQENTVYRRAQRGDGVVYGFRLLAAAKAAWRMRRAALQTKKKAKSSVVVPQVTPDLAIARGVAERIAFIRTLCTLRGLRAPRWFRRTTFIASAAAFLALGSWWWGPLGAAVVASVILLHEAGHWLAMKLAGFRDVQVFFVPGMGGATSGEKHEAHPMTHLMVYLAGPVPGLLLALAVFAWVAWTPDHSASAWYPLLMTGTIATLFINALNMLPVLPLDGGRVVDLLLVGRLPWLRFVFALASGGLLLVSGISSGDNVLRVIGIAMLFASQHHYRVAKASALLLREKTSATSRAPEFAAAAAQLYDFLCRPAFQKWPYATKLAVGQALLPRYLGRVPRWRETVLGMLIYVVCALLPLVGMVSLAIVAPANVIGAFGAGTRQALDHTTSHDPAGPTANPNRAAQADGAALQTAHRADRAATVAAALDPAQRQAAFEDAIQSAEEDGDHEDAIRLARQNLAETGQLPAPAHEHAQAARLLANTLRNKDLSDAQRVEADTLLLSAEAILRQRLASKTEKRDAQLLAQVLQLRPAPADKAAQLAMRQEVVALLAPSAAPGDDALADARRELAAALDRVGQADAAEQALSQAVADTSSAPDTPSNKIFRQRLLNDLAWMLLTHRKLQAAEQIANAQLSASNQSPYEEHLNHRNAHLILLMSARLQGNWNAANQHAIAIRDAKPVNSASGGNWIARLLLASVKAPPPDRRIGLLVIESERALGHSTVADKLVADARNSAPAWEKQLAASNNCRMHVTDRLWQREYQQALLDIEMREFTCHVPEGAQAKAAE